MSSIDLSGEWVKSIGEHLFKEARVSVGDYTIHHHVRTEDGLEVDIAGVG